MNKKSFFIKQATLYQLYKNHRFPTDAHFLGWLKHANELTSDLYLDLINDTPLRRWFITAKNPRNLENQSENNKSVQMETKKSNTQLKESDQFTIYSDSKLYLLEAQQAIEDPYILKKGEKIWHWDDMPTGNASDFKVLGSIQFGTTVGYSRRGDKYYLWVVDSENHLHTEEAAFIPENFLQELISEVKVEPPLKTQNISSLKSRVMSVLESEIVGQPTVKKLQEVVKPFFDKNMRWGALEELANHVMIGSTVRDLNEIIDNILAEFSVKHYPKQISEESLSEFWNDLEEISPQLKDLILQSKAAKVGLLGKLAT